MNDLASRLSDLRVVVCAGPGGVGKTTVSAAVALRLAADGRRVALVTIDPARRLAEALGLDDLGNQPQPVDPARFGECGLELTGELSAMMLDVKRTFDELIELLAPEQRTAQQIMSNRVYGQISSAVAGSQEYTAMAKLFELDRQGSYDAIVLDTPPSRSAVDFLTAPQHLSGFLDSRALGLFLKPTGVAMRVTGLALSALRRIIGVGMLEDLTTFFQLMTGLMDGFRARSEDVEALLVAPSTGFLVVTAPERAPVDEAIHLSAELDRLGMHQTGVIVNRLQPLDPDGLDVEATIARLKEDLDDELAGQISRAHAELQRLAGRQRVALERLTAGGEDQPMFCLQDRSADVHDLRGLVALQAELFG